MAVEYLTWLSHITGCDCFLQAFGRSLQCVLNAVVWLFQGQLSLQKMWFYLQPTMRTLDILASIANSINRVSRTFFKLCNNFLFYTFKFHAFKCFLFTVFCLHLCTDIMGEGVGFWGLHFFIFQIVCFRLN